MTVTLGHTVYKGHTLSGSEVLTFGADFNAWLDTIKGTVAANGASTVVATQDTDGFYTSITLTAPVLRSISSGGSVTLTDLNVDLNAKKVYATVIGANGVGTVTNVALWDIDTVLGPTNIALPANGSGTFNLAVQGLHLTADGSAKVVSSLGLVTLGKATLAAVSDFGGLSMTLNSTAVPPQASCSVSFKTSNKNAQLFNTEVTINNPSSNAATGWQVNWHYAKPTLLLKVKNAKLSNKGLTNYTAAPTATNATIAAGASTSFSFRGHANGGAPAVSDLSATLGDQACAVNQQ
ncbi:hypothetical protein JY96_10835 [Aquabacterium sp. NJ1]|uniref:cellulose binding domain-containing protein n=1 Tax=Aquabacterium sp. NJ1 TaxID=1538295 RepID=UPI00052E4288|nr:cellulose binding domain-containing protein [Aquabacterium sp. NJ1]KGM40361.1 hypothetical protein JY96_10835 [Aquabacterium sp. NJ1]